MLLFASFLTPTGAQRACRRRWRSIGSLAGVAAWLLGSSAWWAVSAMLLFAVVPLTVVVIFPTNKRLLDPDLEATNPAALGLLMRWGTLHWLRTGLSFLAFGVQVLQTHAL